MAIVTSYGCRPNTMQRQLLPVTHTLHQSIRNNDLVFGALDFAHPSVLTCYSLQLPFGFDARVRCNQMEVRADVVTSLI